MNPDQSVAPAIVVVQQAYGTNVHEVCNATFAMPVTSKQWRDKVVHKNLISCFLTEVGRKWTTQDL